MNALKHGGDAAPENEAAVMRALGEDPEQYEALQRGLAATYGPGDALWNQQLEDLAKLYWRRNRIERMQTGLMRRALEALAERQRQRRKEIAAATFDPSHTAAIDIDLGDPTDPCVRLRLLLSLLGVLRTQVRQRVFKPRQEHVIETYYRGEIGWRPGRFRHLLWLFIERAKAERQDEQEVQDFVSEYFQGGEAGVESCYQELLGVLEEEIADVEEEFQHAVEAQEKRDAIERDACLAPAEETWEKLLRREAALDRAIDRKVRIILTMGKEHARRLGEQAGPPKSVPSDRDWQELAKQVGLDPAEEAPTFRSALAEGGPAPGGADAGHGTTESPSAEHAHKNIKLPEQSQNDLENKASAAEEANA